MSNFMTVSMPESEQERFRQWMKSLSQENTNQCKRLVVSTVYSIARHAMMFAPVDKGVLKTSIHPAINSNRMGGKVFTQRKYAPYVEFGTGTKVVAPADVADYAITFKGAGIRQVNLRAQPYLFPAVRIGLLEMEAKLNLMGFKKV
jgi:hypothetical protein